MTIKNVILNKKNYTLESLFIDNGLKVIITCIIDKKNIKYEETKISIKRKRVKERMREIKMIG